VFHVKHSIEERLSYRTGLARCRRVRFRGAGRVELEFRVSIRDQEVSLETPEGHQSRAQNGPVHRETHRILTSAEGKRNQAPGGGVGMSTHGSGNVK